jgi:hypothetical protein
VKYLIRQGEGPLEGWLRCEREWAESERKRAQVILEAGGRAPDHKRVRSYLHDPRQLRGVPIAGANVGGAIRYTNPESECLRKERAA